MDSYNPRINTENFKHNKLYRVMDSFSWGVFYFRTDELLISKILIKYEVDRGKKKLPTNAYGVFIYRISDQNEILISANSIMRVSAFGPLELVKDQSLIAGHEYGLL